ncbi:MAG: hypothetical protein QM754_00555 [Tepidisphaeraceae bacterium]
MFDKNDDCFINDECMSNATSATCVDGESISLKAAARDSRFWKDGKPANPSKVHRWVRKGRKAANGTRVFLEASYTVNGIVTTRAAIGRFVEAIQRPICAAAPSLPPVGHNQAAAALDAMGL